MSKNTPADDLTGYNLAHLTGADDLRGIWQPGSIPVDYFGENPALALSRLDLPVPVNLADL